jgi:hypothetical protein
VTCVIIYPILNRCRYLCSTLKDGGWMSHQFLRKIDTCVPYMTTVTTWGKTKPTKRLILSLLPCGDKLDIRAGALRKNQERIHCTKCENRSMGFEE